MRLLDVACGTGDLSIQAALLHPGIRATGVDFSMQMLRVGAEKVRRKGLTHRITLERGDARALPYPDSTFDVAAIAFGMRNIPDGISALKEMVRVTVPGGQVIVLEMTFAPSPAFRWLYGLYLLHVLPHLAALFAGNAAAYSYLADSISHFPQPEALSGLMREAGLTHVAYRGLTFGSTFLHIGRRREDS
jgi:demethylmenaquinone methyltransferase/2-methoxy-6-polyprenyl-1,4-benzoquinol methylase